MQHHLDKIVKILTVLLANFGIDSFVYFLEETLHIFSLERGIESDELVDDTSKRPNI
jgi:hypothetical protein